MGEFDLKGNRPSPIDGLYGPLTQGTTNVILGLDAADGNIPAQTTQQQAATQLADMKDKFAPAANGDPSELVVSVVNGMRGGVGQQDDHIREFLNNNEIPATNDIKADIQTFADKYGVPAPAVEQTLRVDVTSTTPDQTVDLGPAVTPADRRGVSEAAVESTPTNEVLFDRYTIDGKPGSQPILIKAKGEFDSDVGFHNPESMDPYRDHNNYYAANYYKNLVAEHDRLSGAARVSTGLTDAEEASLQELTELRREIERNNYEVEFKPVDGLDKYSVMSTEGRNYLNDLHDQANAQVRDATVSGGLSTGIQAGGLTEHFSATAQKGMLTLNDNGQLFYATMYHGANNGDSKNTSRNDIRGEGRDGNGALAARFRLDKEFLDHPSTAGLIENASLPTDTAYMSSITHVFDELLEQKSEHDVVQISGSEGIVIQLADERGYVHVTKDGSGHSAEFVSNRDFTRDDNLQAIFDKTPEPLRDADIRDDLDVEDVDSKNAAKKLKEAEAWVEENIIEPAESDNHSTVAYVNRGP